MANYAQQQQQQQQQHRSRGLLGSGPMGVGAAMPGRGGRGGGSGMMGVLGGGGGGGGGKRGGGAMGGRGGGGLRPSLNANADLSQQQYGGGSNVAGMVQRPSQVHTNSMWQLHPGMMSAPQVRGCGGVGNWRGYLPASAGKRVWRGDRRAGRCLMFNGFLVSTQRRHA
jgi:hypothetical protein